MKSIFVVIFIGLVVGIFGQSDPSFDHQTATYHAQFEPTYVNSEEMTLTAYYSPDTSIKTETDFVLKATTYLDIGTPGWNSWSFCDAGCSVSFIRNKESFAIFQAALNAIHAGIPVRILTNNYNNVLPAGTIDPLSFLAVAGADVRYYTTTTFLHTKYLAIDKNAVSVSSINYDYTSFMENREAGLLIEGDGAKPIVSYLDSIFTSDFNQAIKWPVQTYNSSDMAIINDKSKVPVVIPPPKHYTGAYVTDTHKITAHYSEVGIMTAPDYAWETFTAAVNASKSTLDIYIYQITGSICPVLLARVKAGVKLTLLVSNKIFSKYDSAAATACYTTLYNAGVTIRKTAKYMYRFSHQKFWIVDGSVMFMSTGNMSPTDFPFGNTFPPYSQSGWQDTNRDYIVKVKDTAMISVFKNVMNEDYKRGYDWTPDMTQE